MADKKVSEMTEADPIVDEIADMIADWFGRSVIDADRELAAQIIHRLIKTD